MHTFPDRLTKGMYWAGNARQERLTRIVKTNHLNPGTKTLRYALQARAHVTPADRQPPAKNYRCGEACSWTYIPRRAGQIFARRMPPFLVLFKAHRGNRMGDAFPKENEKLLATLDRWHSLYSPTANPVPAAVDEHRFQTKRRFSRHLPQSGCGGTVDRAASGACSLASGPIAQHQGTKCQASSSGDISSRIGDAAPLPAKGPDCQPIRNST